MSHRTRVLAAMALAVLGLAAVAPPATAASAQPQSWWWIGAPLPPPVQVPAGGAWIAAGPNATLSVAALHIVTNGSGVRLQESIDQVTPDAKVVACPATRTWHDAEGGAMTDAPSFDCSHNQVPGATSPDGHTMVFDLPSSTVNAGAIDVVLVPDPTAAAMSVTFTSATVDPTDGAPVAASTSLPVDPVPTTLAPSSSVARPSAIAPAPAPSGRTAAPVVADAAASPSRVAVAITRPAPSAPNLFTGLALALIAAGAWFGIARTALVRRP
jgi:hypothetical protein